MFNYGDVSEEMKEYFARGEKRAKQLDNRGPVVFDKDGKLENKIVRDYEKYGFYIFQNVYKKQELKEIERGFFSILDRLPKDRNSKLDKNGRMAIGSDCKANTLYWSKPLADPFGGTKLAGGRHPVKMIEPKTEGIKKDIVYLISGSLQFSNSHLRAYAHPDLLAIAEQINGEDFVPFSDALFIKEPGKGASVAWHQDGITHWGNKIWDPFCHGFNFMAQLYGSTAANGVWIVPGTHKLGKLNIKKLIAESGSERLEEAVPLICDPGDVAITNRQVLHGSFANTSNDWRVTLNFGFHKKSSVLNVRGGGALLSGNSKIYDENRIEIRSRVIPYAINIRKKRFPDEKYFLYKPFMQGKNKEIKKLNLKDYNLLDLSI